MNRLSSEALFMSLGTPLSVLKRSESEPKQPAAKPGRLPIDFEHVRACIRARRLTCTSRRNQFRALRYPACTARRVAGRRVRETRHACQFLNVAPNTKKLDQLAEIRRQTAEQARDLNTNMHANKGPPPFLASPPNGNMFVKSRKPSQLAKPKPKKIRNSSGSHLGCMGVVD